MKIRDTLTPFLRRLPEAVAKEADLEMRRGAYEIEAAARKNIPFLTGHASRSIRTRRLRRFLYRIGTQIKSGGYPYPWKLEYGGIRVRVGTTMQPRKMWPAKARRGGGQDQMPWLRPAFLSYRDRYRERLIEVLRKGLRP